MKLPFTLKAAEDLFLSLSVSLCLSTSLLVPNFVFSFVVVGVFFLFLFCSFCIKFRIFFCHSSTIYLFFLFVVSFFEIFFEISLLKHKKKLIKKKKKKKKKKAVFPIPRSFHLTAILSKPHV